MLEGAEPPHTDLLEPAEDQGARELPPPADASRRRRRRLLALGAVIAVAAAAVAIVLDASGSAARHTGDTGVPPGETTATVQRRTLSESSTVDGTLGYGSKLEVFDRLGGTFTWLPAAGSQIRRGGTLFRINDTPVVLFYGALPAYRTLKEGVSDGPDVSELNENLIDLGYDPYGAIGDLEAFGEGTAAAVKRWQEAEGLKQTGVVELGRVVFAPSTRRVTEVHVSLGQDPPGAEPATTAEPEKPASEKPASKEPASKEPASKKPASKKPASKKPASKKPAAKEPAGKPSKGSSGQEQPEGKEASSDPAKKEASKEPGGKEGQSPGEGSGGGELALTTTSPQQIVQVALKAEQQQLARVGEHVPVTLPGGEVVHGRITSVGTVATQPKSGGNEGGGSGGSSESPTIPVTITLDHAVARLDEAPVSVELVESVRHGVLTVPATALIATGGGGYAVEALSGDRRSTLPVTPGMFAGGYVQVEGAGLHEGLSVIVSQ